MSISHDDLLKKYMENPFAADDENLPLAMAPSCRGGGDDDAMISVVGDRFCVPYTLEMGVTRKVRGMLSKTSYDAVDTVGNHRLCVDGALWKIPRKRVMRDPSGLPVLTMRDNGIALRQQWVINEGESCDAKRFLFSAVEAHAVNLKNQLSVHLAAGATAQPPAADFRVTGSLASLSFKVRRGKRVIAEVSHSYTLRSLWKGKETFHVKIYPDVDYAFILALLVIMHENDI